MAAGEGDSSPAQGNKDSSVIVRDKLNHVLSCPAKAGAKKLQALPDKPYPEAGAPTLEKRGIPVLFNRGIFRN